jgi:hydrogenase maturation protease
MGDDAIGARTLEELSRRYTLPPTVRLIASAAPMARLLAELEGIDQLIVVDGVRSGGAPGAIHSMGLAEFERLASSGRGACSSHGVGLTDLCALLSALGRCPDMRIIGVEAGEVDEVGPARSLYLSGELSGPVEAALPRAVDAVVEELRRLGVAVEEKETVRRHA